MSRIVFLLREKCELFCFFNEEVEIVEYDLLLYTTLSKVLLDFEITVEIPHFPYFFFLCGENILHLIYIFYKLNLIKVLLEIIK